MPQYLSSEVALLAFRVRESHSVRLLAHVSIMVCQASPVADLR